MAHVCLSLCCSSFVYAVLISKTELEDLGKKEKEKKRATLVDISKCDIKLKNYLLM